MSRHSPSSRLACALALLCLAAPALAHPAKDAAPPPAARPAPAPPAKPVDPARPGEPAKPVDPARPGEPAKPADPARPAQPAKPAEPAKPADPNRPGPAKPGDKKDLKKEAPAADPNATGTQIGVVRTFPAGTADQVLREAFRCALDYADPNMGFDCYAALNVELNRDNENALTHLRLYQWTYFRKRAASYIVESDPFAVKVTRRDPSTLPVDAKTTKLFLKSRHRDMPAPIIFRREAGAWRIYANSL